MEKVSFELEAVTPMFMSGADPMTGPPEFRAPSIKGLLRFWYRAIYPDYDPAEEDRLFGSTDHRSPFKLKTEIIKGVIGSKGEKKYDSLAYLGYGLFKYVKEGKKNVTIRPFFDVGSQFKVHFLFRKQADARDREKVLRAFWALSMLGGLGARSRRGFGSYQINRVQAGNNNPIDMTFNFKDRTDFINYLNHSIGFIKKQYRLPEHSAFSLNSRLIVTEAFHPHSRSSAFENICGLFKNYRNYYAPRRSQAAQNDHDLMRDFLNGTKMPKISPQRAAFGLPHNYFFTKSLNKVKGFVDFVGEDNEASGLICLNSEPDAFKSEEKKEKYRRGSPLFIHIQRFEDKTDCAVVTFLPSAFLPEGRKIRLSGNGKYIYVAPPDFRAIDVFLDHLASNPKNDEIKII